MSKEDDECAILSTRSLLRSLSSTCGEEISSFPPEPSWSASCRLTTSSGSWTISLPGFRWPYMFGVLRDLNGVIEIVI